MASIKIFDIVLNGVDMEKFCALDIPSKIEYIQKHSQQKDEVAIRQFLKLPPKQFIAACCGFTKQVKPKDNGGNISNTVRESAKDADKTETAGLDAQGNKAKGNRTLGTKSKRVPKGRNANG